MAGLYLRYSVSTSCAGHDDQETNMKIYCPKCNSTIENININVQENVCVCSKCNEAFKLSELTDQDNINEAEYLLRNPPKGILISKTNDHIKIKITTRSIGGVFLTVFSLFFSGISFLGFFHFVMTKTIIPSLFMLMFVVFSIILWGKVFFSIFGKVEIIININKIIQDYIFIGTGIIGRKHNINWSKINSIYEHTTHNSEGTSSKEIYISIENKLIKIPLSYFNENKKRFLFRVLEYYKQKNSMN